MSMDISMSMSMNMNTFEKKLQKCENDFGNKILYKYLQDNRV